MDRRLLIYVLCCSLLVSAGYCKKLETVPESAAPGEIVHLHSKSAQFDKQGTIRVRFGDMPAAVVEIIDPNTITAMVPQIEPGVVDVKVVDGRFEAEQKFRVRRPTKRRAFFRIEHGEITFQMAQPYTGLYSSMEESGRRLSYEVLDQKGQLIYLGAILHPEDSSIEVFGNPEPGQMHQHPRKGSVLFAVKIPYLEGQTRVRFYEAAPGLNLKDPVARQDRTYLQEVTIP